jgi:hypothetical protein
VWPWEAHVQSVQKLQFNFQRKGQQRMKSGGPLSCAHTHGTETSTSASRARSDVGVAVLGPGHGPS